MVEGGRGEVYQDVREFALRASWAREKLGGVPVALGHIGGVQDALAHLGVIQRLLDAVGLLPAQPLLLHQLLQPVAGGRFTGTSGRSP